MNQSAVPGPSNSLMRLLSRNSDQSTKKPRDALTKKKNKQRLMEIILAILMKYIFTNVLGPEFREIKGLDCGNKR